MEHVTEQIRGSYYGCGLLRADQRTGVFPSPPEWGDEVNRTSTETPEEYRERTAGLVCPGYVVSLPQVQEAALCAAWQDKGSLDARLDGEPVTTLLRDAIDVFRGASGEVEMHMIHGGDK